MGHRRGAAHTEGTFDDWYRSYSVPLRACCRRILGDDAAAQDVVQETLLRAWTNREQFVSQAQVAPWLWVVARNLCRDQLRRRKHVVVSDSLPEIADDRADPARGVEVEIERKAVRAALGSLSHRHREVLVLRDVRGLDYEELASRLGVSPTGARAVLFRARRSLKNALSSSGDALGALVPVGLVRRAVDVAQNLSSRTTPRTTLALEVAAAALAAAMASGPLADAPVQQPTASVQSPAMTQSPAQVPDATAVADRVIPPVEVPSAVTPSADSAPAAETTQATWHASVGVLDRIGVSLGVVSDPNDPGLTAQLLSLVPSIDLGILGSPPPAPAP